MDDPKLEQSNSVTHLQLLVQFLVSFCGTTFIVLFLLPTSILMPKETFPVGIQAIFLIVLLVASLSGEVLIYLRPKLISKQQQKAVANFRYLGAAFAIIFIIIAAILNFIL